MLNVTPIYLESGHGASTRDTLSVGPARTPDRRARHCGRGPQARWSGV